VKSRPHRRRPLRGALGFRVLGLLRRRSLARMIASTEDTARELGFRDLGNGLVFLAGGDRRTAIVQRMLSDASNALLFGRRKTAVAAAALGGIALRSRR
jgi:hypothetical protein